jgi:hypothetical protein
VNEPNKLEYLPLVQTLDKAERLAKDKHSSLLISYERKMFYKIGLREGFCHVQVKKLLKVKKCLRLSWPGVEFTALIFLRNLRMGPVS